MDTRSARLQRQYLPVFADREVVVSLTVVSLTHRLMSPDRRRRHLRKFPHRQVGEDPEQLSGVIENLRSLRIETVQLEGHLHCLAVALQAGISPFELQTGHTFQCWIGRAPETFLQPRQRL